MDDCDALSQLNRDLFAAEEKKRIGNEAWDQWLGHVLDEDFAIRRSNPAVPRQNREAMIQWIRERAVGHRELLPAETVWCCKSLGVIVGPVLMRDDKGHVRKYQNIKVFRRHPSHGWQCVYWQVTEENPA
jgi:hypothetical protein